MTGIEDLTGLVIFECSAWWLWWPELSLPHTCPLSPELHLLVLFIEYTSRLTSRCCLITVQHSVVQPWCRHFTIASKHYAIAHGTTTSMTTKQLRVHSPHTWTATVSRTEMIGRAWRWRKRKPQWRMSRENMWTTSCLDIASLNLWSLNKLLEQKRIWSTGTLQPLLRRPRTTSSSVRTTSPAQESARSFITLLNRSAWV